MAMAGSCAIESFHKVAEHGGNIDGFQCGKSPRRPIVIRFLAPPDHRQRPFWARRRWRKVWKNLVDVPKTDDAPYRGQDRCACRRHRGGSGDHARLWVALKVAVEVWQLTLTVPGQPTCTLETLAEEKYKLAKSVPDGFFGSPSGSTARPETLRTLSEQLASNGFRRGPA